MEMHSFKIADIPIGKDFPTVFFAEIGCFFNTNVDVATSMIRKIILASQQNPGIPIILKSEILDDPEICLQTEVQEPYVDKSGNVKRENYRDLIERKTVSRQTYRMMFSLCREYNMPFILSVYDMNGADFAFEQGVSAIKIASSNIVHIPLIQYVARFDLPMIIDTGRATLDEVHRAVDTAKNAGCNNIVLQHSPDGHPALPQAHNLRILKAYAETFRLPVGLSDHYVGREMMYMSMAYDVSVIEKGVHIDPDELDIDVSHTMGLDLLPETLAILNDCWLAKGKNKRDVNDKIQGNIGTSQRQCLVAAKDLKAGEIISLETVRFAFPRNADNIFVEEWENVIGKPVKNDKMSGKALLKTDI